MLKYSSSFLEEDGPPPTGLISLMERAPPPPVRTLSFWVVDHIQSAGGALFFCSAGFHLRQRHNSVVRS